MSPELAAAVGVAMSDYGFDRVGALFYLAVSYGVIGGDVVNVGASDDKDERQIIAELEAAIAGGKI